MAFRIRYERAALDELLALSAAARARVVEEVARHLGQDPTRTTRRKKELKGLSPPWSHVPPVWQLRVGAYRVFYDVDAEASTVIVRAVRLKDRRTTKEIV